MKNPVVAVLILVAAAVGGIAAFSQDIHILTKAVGCLPYELGVMRYEGTGTLTIKIPEYTWKKISTINNTKGTGNHHCESDCDGEPTRTNYRVSVDVPPSREGNARILKNTTLKCLRGPCGGWNEVIDVEIINGDQKAIASFDVWSKPTTWRLSADLYERQVVNEAKTSELLSFSDTELLEIPAPRTASSIVISGTMPDGNALSFDLGKLDVDKTDHTGTFRLLRATPDSLNDSMLYVIKFSNPYCEI